MRLGLEAAERQRPLAGRGHAVTDGKFGQQDFLVAEFARRVVTALDVGPQVAGKLDRLAAGGEHVRPAVLAGGGDLQGGAQQTRVGHLRSHRALPDQLVKTGLVGRQRQRLRPLAEIGGADGLVGFLRVLDLGLVLPRAAVEGVAIHLLDRLGRLAQGPVAQRGGVGTVVGDDAVLEQPLGRAHRAVGREPELAIGFLLQRRRGERRRRPLRCRLLLDGSDGPRQPAGQAVAHGLGRGLVEQADVAADEVAGGGVEVLAGGHALVADPHQGGGELRLAGADPRVEVPVAAAVEGASFFLAFDDQPHRDALDTARTQSGLDLLPEHRRQHVAIQAVEDAPAFLRVDQLEVDVAGLIDGLADGFLGDLVKDDPLDRALGLQHLAQVPADRLTLTVRVGRQQHFGGFLDGGLELPDPRLPVRRDDVVRLEAVVHVHAHPPPRLLLDRLGDLAGVLGQIADMPHARLDPELVA